MLVLNDTNRTYVGHLEVELWHLEGRVKVWWPLSLSEPEGQMDLKIDT